jgi:Domain of unknown function (DUF1929)/Bacterial Ig domain
LAAVLGVAALLGSAGATAGQAGDRRVEAGAGDHPHSRDLGVAGMSEAELRKVETITLGPAHAREHAMLRRAQREAAAEGEEEARRVVSSAGDRVDPEDGATGERSAQLAAAADADPGEVGRWASTMINLEIVAIHAALLPTGKVLFFSFPKSPYTNSAQVWLWDPASGQQVRKDPPLVTDPRDGLTKPANIWCAGHTFSADGELVVFGGNLDFETATQEYKGLNKVYTFNPFTETWREQPEMRHGRWYPTGVRMADGRVPIISGWDESGTDRVNEDVDLFTPPASPGGVGTTSLIGSTGGTGQPPTGEYYPHMFAMPSGRTLVAGPNKENTWFFNSVGTDSFTWSSYAPMSRRRLWGTAVLVPGEASKVMMLGGTDYSLNPSTTTTEVFDEASPGQGWQPAAPNVIGRGHANTVLLPDGSMVQVGGGVGSDATEPVESRKYAAGDEHKQVELWDPETKTWRLGPPQEEWRAYHSTALLLPDGRVLSAGDDLHGGGVTDTGEIYEPPYLHRGPRPSITSAPATIEAGETFGVTTPDTNIKGAALVAPGAATHAVDMNQRYLPLTVSRRTGCVDVAAPPNARVAPPGYYMLFLLNDQGVPSVAKFVKLLEGGSPPGACDTPPPPADTTSPAVTLTAPAPGEVSGVVDLRAAASDNVGVAGVQFRVDGENIGAEDRAAPWSASWKTTDVANGSHTLMAVARDAAGNRTTSAPVTVTVVNSDQTPPTVNLTAPANGATLSGPNTLTASAYDNVGVDGVQFRVDGENIGPEDRSAPWSASWNTTDVANGSHTLTAVARDAADNPTTSAPVTVTVQNIPRVGEDTPDEPGPEIPPQKPGPPGGNSPRTPPPATAPPATAPHAPTNLAPRLNGLKLSSARFRKRTTIRFRLSEAATVTLSFERRLPGERAGGRCVKPTPRPRPKCGRYVRATSELTLQGRAGANKVRLGPRLPSGRRLAPGTYQLTLVATDPSGKRSAPARAQFRLLRMRAAKPARASLIEIEGPLGKSSVFSGFSPYV